MNEQYEGARKHAGVQGVEQLAGKRNEEREDAISLPWPIARTAVLVVAGGCALLGLLAGGLGGFLIFVGLPLLIVGLCGTASGRLHTLWLRSRRASVVTLGAGLIVVLVGSAAYGAQRDPDVSVAAVTTSGHSTALPSSTPTGPVVTEADVPVVEPIPFESTVAESGGMDVGTSVVTVSGVNGERTTMYRVTYEDGVEVARVIASTTVTREPVNQVTTNGTRVPAPVPAPAAASGCDPNYTGACVPVDSDVDCSGGSGNGPSYVRGPVTVVGSDIYDLDRDGDGIACD
ncbi:hypothetical protein GCM10022198_14650 [Klugiella xanthotipulae]|uniref:Surface rod structure-forming protein G n=1 Tax=Klugiella xanthotipulae TaxID=244735 RepID=A0A543I6L1_9MICO|nr:G5 domain-containing protein [Klugiella xanthotipulae]TQM66243.1 surface rod structure-forming protein G [Klugiella xanthotipulae]